MDSWDNHPDDTGRRPGLTRAWRASSVSNAHLLLVGESRPMREAEAVLRDAGHRVETADGAAALEALEREPADLVLIRWQPPRPEE